MAEASKPLGWLPGTLIAAGLLLPVAGVLSGGPDIVDGVVFGVVALAAAEASGVAKPRLLVAVFLFAGALGGVAGGLFASLQSYITPDAFTFEMSVLFFIAILIGGRGSILGPANHCGLAGLRPTFGRVSRHGAMVLSWSLDKLGPICLTPDDCGLVLEAIAGPDAADPSMTDRPFRYEPAPPRRRLRAMLVGVTRHPLE